MILTAEQIARELRPDWRAPLPPDPTPRQELEAWERDAEATHYAIYLARHRADLRQRFELRRRFAKPL